MKQDKFYFAKFLNAHDIQQYFFSKCINECIFVGSSNVTMAEEEDEGEPEEIVCPQGKPLY